MFWTCLCDEMELVRQPDGTKQCGQAVIAMLTGRTLAEVVAVMGTEGNYPATLRKHARDFDIELARHSKPVVDGRGPTGQPGAVFMHRPASHWAAWDGERFYDPRGTVYDRLPDDAAAGVYVIEDVT